MSHRSTSSTGKPGGEVFFPAITQKAAENMCQTRSSLVFELVVTPFCGVQYELYSPCVGKNMLLCVDFFVDFRLSLPVEFRTKMGWSRFNFWHRHNINPSLRHCWKVLQIRKKKTSQYSDEIEKSKYHLTGVSWSHVCAVNVSTPFCQWNQIVLPWQSRWRPGASYFLAAPQYRQGTTGVAISRLRSREKKLELLGDVKTCFVCFKTNKSNTLMMGIYVYVIT